jgi:hypothetical protein
LGFGGGFVGEVGQSQGYHTLSLLKGERTYERSIEKDSEDVNV